MNEHLEWGIKHLNTFKGASGNDNGGIWCIKWADGANDPLIYNDRDEKIKFNVSDIMLAEYIVSLHNLSKYLIKEVELKNVKTG